LGIRVSLLGKQLNLRRDGRDFYVLMHIYKTDDELLEKLAEAAHEIFCDDLRAKGYKYGAVTQRSKKIHSSLKPYHELPENEKEQNRNNVRDIPNKLESIGYTLLPACGDKSPSELSDDEVEKLAELEHERWMQQKLETGWKYAKRTNKLRKLHKDLILWRDLHHDEQEKDRILVRGIPRILGKAGYTIARLS
jgi:hypothetical protein